MSSIDEALAQALAVEEEASQQWVQLSQYGTKEFYSDVDIPIDATQRTISDFDENISTMGENNAQYLSFMIDRYCDGIDLKDMRFRIQYMLESGVGSVGDVVNAYYNDQYIKFGWTIPIEATQTAGTIEIMVFCIGIIESAEYILKTKPVKYTIHNALPIGGGIPKPDENWFLSFITDMDEKVATAQGYADSANQASQSAEQSKLSVDESKTHIDTVAAQVESNAEQSAADAQNAATSASAAKESEEKAKQYVDNVLAISPAQVTDAITVDPSFAGGLKVNQFYGKSEQKQYSGKNLLNRANDIANAFLDASNKVLSTANGFHVCYAKIDSNTTYTVSKKAGSTFRVATFENIPSISEKFISTMADHTATKITFTSEKNANYVAVDYWGNDGTGAYSSILDSVQIEKGSEATAYEPYREQSVTLTGITLNAIPVSSGGNVTIDGQQYISDYLDVERGKIVRMCKEIDFEKVSVSGRYANILTNSKEARWNAGHIGIKVISMYESSNKVGFINSIRRLPKGIATWDYDEVGVWQCGQGSSGSSKDDISIRIPSESTAPEYLKSIGGCKGLFIASTPTEESLSDELAEKLLALKTYAGVTNIFVSSTELSPMVELEYGAGTAGAYVLQALNLAKINELNIAALTTSNNTEATIE